jgi:RNA polymerase sigma-70 factor (ECF subfamily)
VTRNPGAVWRRAAAGDAEAFRQLVEEYDAHLLRLCRALCGDAEMAQEAVQAAWVIAWRKLDSLRDEARVEGWLTVIAINETRRLARDRNRRRAREGLARLVGRVLTNRTAQELDLGSALQLLSAQDQAILLMRYVEDRSSDDVGRSLGMPSATVRTRTRRALQRLREELSDDVG